jgi:actin-related protein
MILNLSFVYQLNAYIGGAYTKVGEAGSEVPSIVVPTAVAYPEHKGHVHKGPDQRYSYAGKDVRMVWGLSSIGLPIARGHVDRDEDMEVLLTHVLEKYPLEERALLVASSATCSLQDKEKLGAILFEKLSLHQLSVQASSHLSLYASGSKSGVVIG